MEMRRAFSLVELALVLVVVGLMAVFGLQAFQGTHGEDCAVATQEQLHSIDAALQNYIVAHARLPKPARLDLGSSSNGYGYEVQGAITDPLDANYGTDIPAGVTSVSGVLIGAVPHATLGLPAHMAADCWGSKFTYAVTNMLTSSNTTSGYPGGAGGVITLNGGTLASPQLQSNNISYVVISHGADKYGATPQAAANGTAMNCNGSAEPLIDRENCNSDTVFFASTHNTGTTEQHFDDLVKFSSKVQSREPCAAQIQNWMGSCSGNSVPLAHGASGSTTNSTGGFTGSVTVTCNDGTLSQSLPTCSAASTCAPTECEAGGMLFEDSCSACVPDGNIHKTIGMGCRRYRCNSGVWQDLGAGGACASSAGC